MCPHVLFKILRLSAALPTHTAPERPLIRMHPQVNLIITTMRKRLTTNLTLIRHISRMRFHMSTQFGSGRKLLIASGTLLTTFLSFQFFTTLSTTFLFFFIFRYLFHLFWWLGLYDLLVVMRQWLWLWHGHRGHHLIVQQIGWLHLLYWHCVAPVIHLDWCYCLNAIAIDWHVILWLDVVI